MKEKFLKLNLLYKIIIVNVVIFVLVNAIILFSPIKGALEWHYLSFPLSTTADLSRLIKTPWTIITHMFLHFDFRHIFWNLFLLYMFGRIFLHYFNEKKVLSIYILGGFSGLTAMILVGLLIPEHGIDGPAYGASAAVMAVIVAIASYIPNHILDIIVIKVKLWIVSSIIVINEFVSLNDGFNFGGHIAHFGGIIFGFIFARQYLKGRDISNRFENFIDRIFSFFNPKKRTVRVVKSRKKSSKRKEGERHFTTDADFNVQKKKKQQQLDQILDKISKSGYDSLTSAERDFLFKQSQG